MANKGFSAKKMKIDELIALGGVAPPTPSSPPSTDLLDEISRLYNELYVQGLTLFFETKWFELKENHVGGSNLTLNLQCNHRVISLFTSFVQSVADIKSTSGEQGETQSECRRGDK